MAKKFQVTDNKSGKKFQIDWDGPNDPTEDDINEVLGSTKNTALETSSPVKEEKNTGLFGTKFASMVPGKSHGTILDNVWNAGKRVDDSLGGYADQILGPISKNYNGEEAAKEGMQKVENPIRSSINTFIPIDSTIQDIKNKNYGGAAANIGMTALGGRALWKGLKGVPQKPPINQIVPDLEPVPQKPQLALPPKSTPDFISHPSGKVAKFGDLDTPEALKGLDLKQPETQLPDIELRPDQFTSIEATGKEPWDFDKPGVRTNPEPFNTPRSQGIQKIDPETGEVTSRDFTETNPNLAHVPNRLRPEAPNVTRLRGLSQGAGKAGDVGEPSRYTFGDESGLGYDKTPKTVNIGESGGKVNTPDLDIPEQMLPSAEPKGPISRFRKAKEPEMDIPTSVEKEIPTKKVGINETKGSIKNFAKANPVFDSIFQKWVKLRGASELVGKDIRNKFANLKDLSKDDVATFQKSLETGDHAGVRDFFDKQLVELKKNGIDVERKNNYLPQMWEDAPEAVSKAFGEKTLAAKAPFEYKSVFKDYQMGIDKGLTPKMSPLELMEWYGKRANKLIADKQFLRDMKANGYISKEMGEGKVPLDPKLIPSSFGKSLTAHPQIAKAIENYLGQDTGVVSKIARGVGKLNSMRLSAGLIPNKPLSTWHGLSMARRALDAQGFKGLGRAIKAGWNPEGAAAAMDKEMPAMIDASKKYGLKLNVENPSAQFGKVFEGPVGKIKGLINKGSELQHKYFEKPLFEKMIPSIKWDYFKDMHSKFMASGMEEAEAGNHAARLAEDVFSGYNTDMLYRNKSVQSLVRTLTLAPDWYESSIKLGAKIPKSFIDLMKDPKNPVAREYAKIGGRIAGQVVVANMLQKALTGKYMFDNPAGHEFDFALGDENKDKRRYVSLFQAEDMAKVPTQIIMSIAKDRSLEEIPHIALNKGSSLVSGLGNILSGEDYKGEPNIFKSKDNYGNSIPFGQRAKNTLGQTFNFLPPQLSVPAQVGMGNASLEEGIAQLGELPLKYGRKKKTRSPFGF